MWIVAAALVVSFHHIHVNEVAHDYLLTYYSTLFDQSTTRPAQIGDVHGIESSGIYLLVTPGRRTPPDEASAGWHFGWGTLALDEPYDRHRMQEIEWDLPLESFAKNLHLHLESQNPIAAAHWYRDVLGAAVETMAANAAAQPVNAIFRRPVAIARLDRVALAIYKAMAPLVSSRGHRIDHIAFKVHDLAAARVALEAAGVKMMVPSAPLGPYETLMIEGPDRLAIELVGPPALRR